ncbi:MAG: hypothetical protein LBI29_01275 [Rickettsiales bacterium]|jgi:cell division protein FtsB|nr:hypothetical protein [Rickettsiales bacterium]
MSNTYDKSLIALVVKIGFNVFLVLYLMHHVLGGNYGLLSQRNMDTILLRDRDSLRNMEREASRKKNKIEGLRKSNLDLDLFEEEVKRNVGLIDNNEIVILYDNRVGD